MNDIFDTYSTYPSMINPNTEGLANTIKTLGTTIYSLLEEIDNREMALAKTNLQQAIFWALRGIIEENIKCEKAHQQNMCENFAQTCKSSLIPNVASETK